MKKLRNIIVILLVGMSILSSCKKELEVIDKDNTNNPSSSITDINVSSDFDWKTTRDINVSLTLPSDKGIMRSKIMSEDGTKLFYQGYPNDTTSRYLHTTITIPSYMHTLKVSNGITEDYVNVAGGELSYDFSGASFKSAVGLDCGECDGQITELELEYVGSTSNPTIKVTQKKGGNHNYVIYEGTPQGAFEFIGVNNHNKMGATIKVYVNDVFNVEIHTSCSVAILAGMTFGDFLIISGMSDNGGALCDVEEEDDSYAGTVIYEDLYPAKGDYDFNDLVVNYNFDINKTYNDYIESIEATFTVRAFGASYHNAFGFQFPTVTSNNITSVTGTVLKPNTIFNMASNGTEQNQSKATFIVYDDAYGIMQHPGEGIGVNTTPGAPYVEPVTITLTIVFEPNTVTYNDLNIGNLNPFIVMKQNRGYEVHLADFEPTDLFDSSLFGVYDDDSDPATGRYFKTDRNLPWAVNIPDTFEYMNEKAVISSGYLKFVAWAESEGAVFADWYLDNPGYRNESNIYQ